MACATIHLAIAKRYLKRNPNINIDDFIAGTLYPDADSDNDKTHYTDKNRGSDNVSHVREKVNLSAFLKEHENLNDFEMGWFLHLITDYLFFEECFTTSYLLSISYDNFCKELYHAYSCVNLYLEEKYDLTRDYYKAYPMPIIQVFPMKSVYYLEKLLIILLIAWIILICQNTLKKLKKMG